MLSVLDRIGDWNPQLLRELKGHLKSRNLLIAVASSLVGQFFFVQYFLSQLPYKDSVSDVYNRYCTDRQYYANTPCVRDTAGNFIINWPEWWHDLFIGLGGIAIFALLVVGTFMLINDLFQEERRGTLNFIRLSPQSELSIMLGKLLGVPIVLYMLIGLAVPLHFWAGLSAEIPLAKIFLFYGVVAASCLFFYTAALVCGSVRSEHSNSLPWLGSGIMLLFLTITTTLYNSRTPVDNPSAWLRLFSPVDSMLYLFPGPNSSYSDHWLDLHLYNLPIGATCVGFIGLVLFNYALWTYWIWQGLKRYFRNPSTTALSKQQSYWLVVCFEVVILGFAVQEPSYYHSDWVLSNLIAISFFNIVLLFVLMAIISPHRQTLQDWARYRKKQVLSDKSFRKYPLLQDLIWGQKSPAVLAMGINLMLAAIPVVLWLLLWPFENFNKTGAIFGVAFFVSLMIIYATIAQLVLMMKTNKRSLWAVGIISAAITLPPLALGVAGIYVYENPTAWLFSTFPWAAIEYGTATTLGLALLGEWTVLVLLNLQLARQLKKAGESASKALFAQRRSLPTS